jgi:hypothetical protein
MNKPLEAIITSYSDYFEYHRDLETGKLTLKINGKQITVEEFNQMQELD